MTEELMVGTIGWDHDSWVGHFYPNDLPDDWRFSYYSNDYRAVLATADHFRPETTADIAEWVEDCDESFRFIVEISEYIILDPQAERLQDFTDALAPLASRVAGFLLRLGDLDDESISLLKTRIDLLQAFCPVCMDLTGESETPESLLNLVKACHIGWCWHPSRDKTPRPGGALLLALSGANDPKEQRLIIESLEEWMQQSNGLAGLFLESPNAASQARVIAEMLGV